MVVITYKGYFLQKLYDRNDAKYISILLRHRSNPHPQGNDGEYTYIGMIRDGYDCINGDSQLNYKYGGAHVTICKLTLPMF